MPYDRVGIAPGALGNMLIEHAPSQPARQPVRPMPARRMSDDIIRTTVAFRPTPMVKKRRGMA